MSSRYKRTSDRGVSNLDRDALIDALKAKQISNLPLRTVSKTYNIPRTSLRRYLASFEASGKDMAAMSDADLKDFVQSLATYGTHKLVW